MRKVRKTSNKRTLLFRKAWRVFSDFIRKRDKYICFTCGAKLEKKNSHAGHLIHGKTSPVYFDPMNVHCQCIKCNLFLNGNRDVYLRNIQKKYGIKKGDWLLSQREKTHYFTISELEKIIEKLR